MSHPTKKLGKIGISQTASESVFEKYPGCFGSSSVIFHPRSDRDGSPSYGYQES